MNKNRRKILKLFGLSYLSVLLFPYYLLYSITKKIINPNLSTEQKKIMLNESTERPFSSPLNNEKRKGFFTAQIVEQNFLLQVLSLIVVRVGLLLQSLYQVLLKQKLIIHLEWKELNIIVQNVVFIMDMFLTMDQQQPKKDFAVTVCA